MALTHLSVPLRQLQAAVAAVGAIRLRVALAALVAAVPTITVQQVRLRLLAGLEPVDKATMAVAAVITALPLAAVAAVVLVVLEPTAQLSAVSAASERPHQSRAQASLELVAAAVLAQVVQDRVALAAVVLVRPLTQTTPALMELQTQAPAVVAAHYIRTVLVITRPQKAATAALASLSSGTRFRQPLLTRTTLPSPSS